MGCKFKLLTSRAIELINSHDEGSEKLIEKRIDWKSSSLDDMITIC